MSWMVSFSLPICLICFVDAWGLSFNEMFPESESAYLHLKVQTHFISWWNNIIGNLLKQLGILSNTPEENLLLDLQEVLQQTIKEEEIFQNSFLSEGEKERRLMYLFIRDLLPGMNGKILSSNESRQSESNRLAQVSPSSQSMGWVVLLGLDAIFLFYIYLFAMRQTESRQTVWLLSFVIWIVFDVMIASTMVVLVMHVFIPSLAMGDFHRLKHRLLQDVMIFRRDLHLKNKDKNQDNPETKKNIKESIYTKSEKSGPEKKTSFNAAEYLFVSNHISQLYPNLEQSQIIRAFSTPWPKRSSRVAAIDVKSSYETDSSSFMMQFVQRILIFLFTNFLSIPPFLQDEVIHLMSTCGLGSLIPLLMKLYAISPMTLVGLAILILILSHFLLRLDNRSAHLKEIKFLEDVSKIISDEDDEFHDNSPLREAPIIRSGDRIEEYLFEDPLDDDSIEIFSDENNFQLWERELSEYISSESSQSSFEDEDSSEAVIRIFTLRKRNFSHESV